MSKVRQTPSIFELDARRLLCPMPVIRTQNRIKDLQPGDRLTVIATDPGVQSDIPAWCRINGHRIITSVIDGREIRLTIEVGLAR
jgi:tRNA 2-thiouridine synthesizing protein A